MVNLDKGITGVVGPNGSGKSNIIDSVRWVMGEQNAKNLRGEKATDIIFAGSEKRRPLSSAEVSLVFDNTDEGSICPPEYRHEQEITLTRRIFSSGEREYLINKKECRFKDLIYFFSSTGLGGRSYSMIQQGQVERILNAKPEDVREILEEAAGTAIYKKRKIEAEKKLELTKVNLSRIDDIITEVEGQLKGLESQVAKAKEYSDLSEELKHKETNLFAHNYSHFKNQLDRIKLSLESDINREAEYIGVSSGLEARHQELQSQLDETDPETQILQEKITRIREQIASAESLIKSSALRLGTGAKRLLDLKKEISEDSENLKTLEAQVDESHRALVAAENATRDLNASIESFEYEVDIATEAAQVYQSRMEEFQEEIRNLERLIESNKFKTEQCEKDIGKLDKDILESKTKILDNEIFLQNAQEELRIIELKAQETKYGLEEEIKTKHRHESSVASFYKKMRESQEKRDSLREKYHESNARLKSLLDLEKGATNVASTISQLQQSLEGKRILENSGGLLAHAISFNAKSTELPRHLCSVFEQWSERLIIRDLEVLHQLVRLSHKQTLGAIPIILSLGQEPTVKQKEHINFWKLKFQLEAIDHYIEFAPGYKDIEVLFENIFVYSGIAFERKMIEEMPPNVVVFTAQGVVFGDQYDLVIGGHGEGGILSRKIEIERLSADLKMLQSQIAESQGQLDQYDMQIAQDREVIALIDQKLQGQNQDVLEVMTQLERVKKTHDHKSEELDLNRSIQESLIQQSKNLRIDKDNLVDIREGLIQELNHAKSELENIKLESESLIERREEIKRQHESRRMDLAKSSAKAQALSDSYRNLKAQLDLIQNKLSRRYNESTQIEVELENARLEQENSHHIIGELLREREALEIEFSQRREATAGIIEETRVIEGRLKDLRDSILLIQKAVSEKKVQLERVSMALEGVKEQSLEKYHLDIERFTFELIPNFDHELEHRSVGKLRQKLENLGAVNMMAVREFEEKKQRHDFIGRQKEEVLSSIDLLIAAISEIEDTSVKKFLETFDRVNTEFGSLFPILFPTGEGRLELTQPDNPLLSGVEIMCRLPGKSKKPMSLFSGGEKALTAISLIFALLKTKPTPFCFLDEVDAPLDEANVGRYNRVLEALSGQFQFIVITHNRRTMEVLDTLYGITMQEPGVSKVVGVDMQKDLPAHLRKSFKDEKVPDIRNESKRDGAVSVATV